MIGGVTIGYRAFCPVWRAYVAQRFKLPRRGVDDFVNGVALAAIASATGGAIVGGVTFDVRWAIPDDDPDVAVILRAIVRYVYPHLDGIVSSLAQRARLQRAESLFRHVTRIEGLSEREQLSLRCDIEWYPVDHHDFDPNLWRAVR